MKRDIIIVAIFFVSVICFGQKVDYESNALNYIIESSKSMLDLESQFKSPITISRLIQPDDIDNLYFGLFKSPLSQEDSLLADKYFKTKAVQLREAKKKYWAENPIEYAQPQRQDTMELCPNDKQPVTVGIISDKYEKRFEKYLAKEIPFYDRKKHVKLMDVNINGDQIKHFTTDRTDFDSKKDALLLVSKHWFIEEEDIAIVRVLLSGIAPWKTIYVFMNGKGEVLRYYCFDLC